MMAIWPRMVSESEVDVHLFTVSLAGRVITHTQMREVREKEK